MIPTFKGITCRLLTLLTNTNMHCCPCKHRENNFSVQSIHSDSLYTILRCEINISNKMKTNKTTLLEQFQNVKIAEKDQIDTLTHINTLVLTFEGWYGDFNKNVSVLSYVYGPKLPLFMKRCGHACVFNVWMKCQPLHISERTDLL